MSSVESFKIIAERSLRYYEMLVQEYNQLERKNFEKTQKERYGFYLNTLELLTGETDISRLVDMVIDKDFLVHVLGQKNIATDLGIDAVYINRENNEVHLFNFKYREMKGLNKEGVTKTELFNSMPFLLHLKGNYEDQDDIPDKIKEKMNEITKILNSTNGKIQLNIISNVERNFDTESIELKILLDQTDVSDIKSYCLKDFISMLSSSKKNIDCELSVKKDKYFQAGDGQVILQSNLLSLLRVSCNDEKKRNNKEDHNSLSSSYYNELEIELSLLDDNVRGYLNKDSINKNAISTLHKEPHNFFSYNNGVTIIADDVNLDKTPAKYVNLSIKNFQIVNGGQTLRNIYEYKNIYTKDYIKTFKEASVLIKIFKTGQNPLLTEKISEYTNTQIAIEPQVLKSITEIQKDIENILASKNIEYIRKIGDVKKREGNYEYRISMEQFGQLLWADMGEPHNVSNKRKDIFTSKYDDIFMNVDIEEKSTLISKFHTIKEEYEQTEYQATDQKYFYITYIVGNYSVSVRDAIRYLEEALVSFDKDIPEARKLIQKGFKEHLQESLIEETPIND